MRKKILKLLTTEKTSVLQERNVYTFLVQKELNKIELRKVIEKDFQVTVLAIRTSVTKAKKRNQKYKGFTKTYKKAYVSLKEGDKIESLSQG
eukprot:COSAG01_NODE_1_length_100484_cov_170.446142_89_plen_92_part_00